MLKLLLPVVADLIPAKQSAMARHSGIIGIDFNIHRVRGYLTLRLAKWQGIAAVFHGHQTVDGKPSHDDDIAVEIVGYKHLLS